MNAVKNSLDPIISVYMCKFINFFPTIIRNAMYEDACEKISLGLSNVPGPKSTWILTGKRCQGIGFIMPCNKSMVGSFSAISHADVVKMIISMDKATMESPAIIAEYLMKSLDEILADPNWRNYGN